MRLGLAVLTALTVAATPALAQPPRPHHRRPLRPAKRIMASKDVLPRSRLTTDGAEEQLCSELMRQTMLDFTLETLLEPRPAAATTDSGQGRR